MGKRPGTFNFSEADLHMMEKHPSERAMEYGKRKPFYLEYIREQKEKGKKDQRTS